MTETTPTQAELVNLTKEELKLFKEIKTNQYGNQICLEQEYISYQYLLSELGVKQ